jgi:hypothetical protein
MEALGKRHSSREFVPDALPLPLVSNMLWAAYGVNRADGGRTAPSALNAQEIDVYVALPEGAYLYDHESHALNLVVERDLRRLCCAYAVFARIRNENVAGGFRLSPA